MNYCRFFSNFSFEMYWQNIHKGLIWKKAQWLVIPNILSFEKQQYKMMILKWVLDIKLLWLLGRKKLLLKPNLLRLYFWLGALSLTMTYRQSSKLLSRIHNISLEQKHYFVHPHSKGYQDGIYITGDDLKYYQLVDENDHKLYDTSIYPWLLSHLNDTYYTECV